MELFLGVGLTSWNPASEFHLDRLQKKEISALIAREIGASWD